MKRTSDTNLRNWYQKDKQFPLMITGTRQTGKTFLIRDFGRMVPQFAELGMRFFRDRIFFEENYLSDDFWENLIQYRNLVPELTTALFIDDISESPHALQWIKTITPPEGWKLIAASANEVMDLTAIRLLPFSFSEFLDAMEENEIADSFREIPYRPHDFQKLKRLFHLYTLIGGMPEVVMKFASTRELADLAPIYEKIQDLLEDEIDNSTLSRKVRNRAKLTLQNAFPFAAERISFRNFASTGAGSREISKILALLKNMLLLDLVYPVTEIKTTGRKFSPRLHLPDTGLINYFSSIQKQIFESNDIMSLFNGQIIRHIAGQEIAASGHDLSFWVRAKPQSEAMVDYILSYKGMTIPVVIRKGEPGRLRSLFQFMDQCNHPFAVRIWDEPIAVRQVKTIKGKKFYLLNLPYFLSGKLKEYLDGFVKLVEK